MCVGSSASAASQIGHRLLQRLRGQTVHEVEIEVIDAGAAHFLDRARDVAAAVDATERAADAPSSKLCAPSETRLMPASR